MFVKFPKFCFNSQAPPHHRPWTDWTLNCEMQNAHRENAGFEESIVSLAFPEVYSQVILEAPPPLPSTIWLRAQMPGPPASRRTSEALTGASKKAAALPCNFRLFHHRKFNHRHRRNWFYHRSTSQIYQAPPPIQLLVVCDQNWLTLNQAYTLFQALTDINLIFGTMRPNGDISRKHLYQILSMQIPKTVIFAKNGSP